MEVDFWPRSVKRFTKAAKLFKLAESLGGVKSLIAHPVTMTHASIPKEKHQDFGLSDGLLRLSVGLEDAEDLIEDLELASKALQTESVFSTFTNELVLSQLS